MKTLFLLFTFLSLAVPLSANTFENHVFEFGLGWENMGLSPETTWMPHTYSAGSRKELSVIAGWRNLGENKVYYSSFARFHYGFDWSMSGSMNLLELELGILGLGVYMSKPLSQFSEEERIGKWFSTFEINFVSLGIGGNLTPNSGGFGEREWTDPDNQFGNQYYPFGNSYAYFHYSLPIRMQFWKELKNLGVGFFIESHAIIIEKSLNRSMPIAIGYNMKTGFVFKFK